MAPCHHADPWQPLICFSSSMIFKNVVFFMQYVTFRGRFIFTQHNVTGIQPNCVVCLSSAHLFIRVVIHGVDRPGQNLF